MSDLLDLSARDVLNGFRRKTISPVEYFIALRDRIDAREDKINALYAYTPDTALSKAKASEQRWMKGEPLGELDGIPVTVKELIATKGDPVPMGTAAMDLAPATEDAPTAARLNEDGAIIFAKTTCPDYGMLSSGLSSFHPLTRNPWDLSQNPGGSSAGAAAAGAAGYGPLHIGTDIGGSVRLPAGWTGLFGFKPSYGRIPIDPYYTGRCAGPMTPRVDDAALLMACVTRPDARDATALPYQEIDWDAPAMDVKGLRVGLMLDAGCGIPAEPEVLAAIRNAASLFAHHGAEVVEIDPVLTRDMLDGLDIAWRARFWGMMRDLSPAKRSEILPYILEWAEAGASASAADVASGFEQTFVMRKACAAAFRNVDFIISPVNPTISFPAEWASPTNDPAKPFEHICFTVPWNMGEQPACSINCGFSKSGIPIGLQIIAPRFEDLKLFQIARAFEAWREPITNWPDI